MTGTRTILCFGDSNTHGTIAMTHPEDMRRHARDVRWPGVLRAELGAGWEVIEEGHPGRTTVQDDPIEGPHKNGLAVLPALLETHRPIDLVILMLGTNDLKASFGVSAYDVGKATGRLLRCIATSTSGPDQSAPAALLVSPVPVTETGWLAETYRDGARKSQELSGYLNVLAEQNGVSFVDAASLAAVDPVDGIHLSADGHRSIGRALATEVMSGGVI